MLEVNGHKLGAEAVAFLVALLCALIRLAQNLWHKSKTTSKDLVFSVLNGASIIPFCLLVAGLFSQSMLDMAISSKLSMALAGLVGLLFVLGEVISPESLRVVPLVNRAAANDDDSMLFAVVDDLQKGLSATEKMAVNQAKISKRIPKDIDGRLLAQCRQHLDRDLRHFEKAAVRKRLLDTA